MLRARPSRRPEEQPEAKRERVVGDESVRLRENGAESVRLRVVRDESVRLRGIDSESSRLDGSTFAREFPPPIARERTESAFLDKNDTRKRTRKSR